MALYHHRWPVALLIQCVGGLEDLFLADINAYPALVNSLAQFVVNSQIGQLSSPFTILPPPNTLL